VASRISLALVLHNHQPVGNFGWVIADVFQQAYAPMLEALERHPRIRVSLHYSGPLLAWLQRERPQFIERLRTLVDRGQVELLGGGWAEPVLASLPERDRVGQLRRMADEVEALSGQRPHGAWLAERVWEPDLPTSLETAGYRWTILDDAHFRAGAVPEENLWGAYTTEDQGHSLTVFASEQGLRYRIPFGAVEDVVAYLHDHATEDGTRVGMMADDGEKFGAWPGTWDHCWGSGRWVERFFEALEANADWLTTVTPSEWLARGAPMGRVYVPTGSYSEMAAWALPADEATAYQEVLHRDLAERRPEARWLRGGFWRNFQVKYREVNDLHKHMLRISSKVAAMPDGAAKTAALDHLYQGQSNDCYWHGLFGGIYIGHMRLATHEHLIAAEDAADRSGGTLEAAELVDVDLDGRDEALMADPGQVVVVDLDEGAGIGAWDVRATRLALTAVMRRRPEAYHATLRTHEAALNGGASAGSGDDTTTGPASIHDLVRTKEADLSAQLHYDSYERRSALVRFLAPNADPADVAAATAVELGDFVAGSWSVVELRPGRLRVTRDGAVTTSDGQAPVRVEKTLTLGGDRAAPSLTVAAEVANLSETTIEARLGLEFSLMMLGGGGNPAAWYDVAGERRRHDSSGVAGAVEQIGQGNDDLGIELLSVPTPPADAWWSPIETVSNSEGGFERVYQGSGLLLSWPLRLGPGERRRVVVENLVSARRDRAAEEAAEEPAVNPPRVRHAT